MFQKISRYWRTVKYLKPVQVRYQLYYRWQRFFDKTNDVDLRNESQSVSNITHHASWITNYETYTDGRFCFLNKTKHFKKSINWNFATFGALWTYNLSYFDYLLQPSMDRQTGLHLIYDFIENIEVGTTCLDSYPISLRVSNWIKFCLKFDVNDSLINDSMYVQLLRLNNNLEYHLLGNHLFENACALLIGGIYLEENKFIRKGREILYEQLDEQILADGAHFELSPMYHQILLYRLLDCYNMLKSTDTNEKEFIQLVESTSTQMLSWLMNITFSNGTIPLVNDAVEGVAPTTKQLKDYAQRLELNIPGKLLKESGYRMIRENEFECFIDVGDIGPDYIPGHAHSDTFSFVLHAQGKPKVVDTAISTYEECERRMEERSTAAHNTVMVNEKEQTEVWKTFRVGRRAYVFNLEENENQISAEHDGYTHLGIGHSRTFKWEPAEIVIKDSVSGGKGTNSKAYLHFHPKVKLREKESTIFADDIVISFTGHDDVAIKSYQYASGFNVLVPASVVEISFCDNLETHIRL